MTDSAGNDRRTAFLVAIDSAVPGEHVLAMREVIVHVIVDGLEE